MLGGRFDSVMAKESPTNKNYIKSILEQASSRFPYIRQYDPQVSVSRGPYYAETWPVGEEGSPNSPRPKQFPISRTGIEVFRPQDFGPSDLAAEIMHIDPFAKSTRNILQNLLSPQQLSQLKRESGDYQESVRLGLPETKAMSNAVDSAMRGYAVGQWPAEANRAMNYTPEQSNLLQSLLSYMQSGYYPLNYSLPRGN